MFMFLRDLRFMAPGRCSRGGKQPSSCRRYVIKMQSGLLFLFFFFFCLHLAFAMLKVVAYQHKVQAVETSDVASIGAGLAISRLEKKRGGRLSAQGSDPNNFPFRIRGGGVALAVFRGVPRALGVVVITRVQNQQVNGV